MKKILFTGGTGFIGSHIAAKLLQQGHFLYFLARPAFGLSAEERIFRAIAPLTAVPKRQYNVVDCDLTSPLTQFKCISDISEAWHCAASLSFKEEDRIETMAINVGGTKNFLELANQWSIKRIHFISTAYRGIKDGTFYNPYEESKALAEELVRQWKEEACGEFTIYRPSVIVGDSKTGYASNFSGYYTCARGFYLMRRFLEADLAKHPAKYAGSGITMENDFLNLPLYFPGLSETTVNMLPVDVAVKIIISLVHFAGIFYVTNNAPVLLQQLVAMSMKALGIKGVLTGDPQLNDNPVLSQLQKQIIQSARYYKPYAYYGVDSPVFDQSETAKALGKPTEFRITDKFIKTILDYAKSVNFKG